MLEVNLRERRISLEMVMPVAALAALVIGAVVASAQPASKSKPATQLATPPPVEMEDEEIVTEVTAPEEAMVVETPAAPAAPRAKAIEEELGTSKLVLEVPEGATVYLGKKKLGVAPIEKMEIVEGRHLIRVDLGDSSFAEWVDVPPGATFSYRLSLTTD